MKKNLLIAMLVSAMAVTSNAQNKYPSWIDNFKVSGYIMSQYQYNSQENAKSNSFNIRIILFLNCQAKCNDFLK